MESREKGSKEALNNQLPYAAYNSNTETAKATLKKGADANGKNELGSVPLHYAAKYGYAEAMKLLIANGADPEIKDNKGFTPMFYAEDEINKANR